MQLEEISSDSSTAKIGGTHNGFIEQDHTLTYQGTTEQPYQPLTKGEIAFYQGIGALIIVTPLLVAWGLNKYFNRLMNGSDFKEFTSN